MKLRLPVFLPLILFLALAALFWFRLGSGDTSRVPSPLVGRAVPDFALPPLEGTGTGVLKPDELRRGTVTLVNVFASWCAPCREEHPQLLALAKNAGLAAKGVRLAGLAYKDDPANSRKFLTDLGNPYALIGIDERGRAAIDWGVYGVPETFIVRGDGTIAYKHIGPISEAGLREIILPQIEKAMAPK